jgi:hypothetical protein
MAHEDGYRIVAEVGQEIEGVLVTYQTLKGLRDKHKAMRVVHMPGRVVRWEIAQPGPLKRVIAALVATKRADRECGSIEQVLINSRP